jgi:integrase
VSVKLRYVLLETLPSGAVRYRFRRGKTKATITGKPGSPEFYRHYSELLHGTVKAPETGSVKGSVQWLVDLYLANLTSRVEAGLSSPLTLKGHKHHLGKLTADHGAKDANMPRGKLIEFRDQYTSTPGAADNLMKAISAMYKWAIQRDLVTVDNPTRGVSRLNRGSEGFSSWVFADFTAYLDKHKSPTTAYTALMLAISTTARRSDIIQIGADNEFERNGRMWLRWKQAKKPHRIVELPMSQALIVATKELRQTPYLKSAYGKPFTIAGFGIRFRSWCDEAKIDKSLHGVRKGISSLLPSHGTTSLELDVLLGHEMNSEETKVYIAVAERSALAVSVIDRLDKILL